MGIDASFRRQCNVRVIRLVTGQALPPHTHEPSELMLLVAEGDVQLVDDVAPGRG